MRFFRHRDYDEAADPQTSLDRLWELGRQDDLKPVVAGNPAAPAFFRIRSCRCSRLRSLTFYH